MEKRFNDKCYSGGKKENRTREKHFYIERARISNEHKINSAGNDATNFFAFSTDDKT